MARFFRGHIAIALKSGGRLRKLKTVDQATVDMRPIAIVNLAGNYQ